MKSDGIMSIGSGSQHRSRQHFQPRFTRRSFLCGASRIGESVSAPRSEMRRINLCTGLLLRGDTLLLVRCKYEGESEPLWTLPGGRQENAETIADTILREFREETSLAVSLRELAYVSESFDNERRLHVVNCTFFVLESNPIVTPAPADPQVVEARFVPVAQAPALLEADVLRIPVAATLAHPHARHYYAFRDRDVSVPFLGRRKVPHG